MLFVYRFLWFCHARSGLLAQQAHGIEAGRAMERAHGNDGGQAGQHVVEAVAQPVVLPHDGASRIEHRESVHPALTAEAHGRRRAQARHAAHGKRAAADGQRTAGMAPKAWRRPTPCRRQRRAGPACRRRAGAATAPPARLRAQRRRPGPGAPRPRHGPPRRHAATRPATRPRPAAP